MRSYLNLLPLATKQDYSNHTRWYPLHHFVLLPAAGVFTIAAGWQLAKTSDGDRTLWIFVTAAFFLMLASLLMIRQHYALGNQNRIIRLEMRLRYYQLTGKRLEPLEEQLGFGRIAALRFAADDELPGLTDRAIKENLSANDIKKAIKNWVADDMRA